MSVDLTLEYYVARLPPAGGAALTELDLSRQLAKGRVTGAEVVRQVAAGTLRRQDLCWRQGMAGWLDIGQVFAPVLGPAEALPEPPPVPGPSPERPAPETPPPLPRPRPAPTAPPPPQAPVKDTRWLALVVVVFWWLLTLGIVLVALTVVVVVLRLALR